MIVSSCFVQNFCGTVCMPGDKSVSHRALIVASQAVGITNIYGLSNGEDVYRTKYALSNMGIEIIESDGVCSVYGLGSGGLSKPSDILDMGNSGTAAALIMGLVAPYSFDTFFYGDKSLRSRSMQSVQSPLSMMGANFTSDRLPLVVFGSDMMVPITYEVLLASAKIKSAILMASLNIPGVSTIIESIHTRSHTEKILSQFNAGISSYIDEYGKSIITIEGCKEFNAIDISIPADPSAAAFFVASAVLAEEGEISIPGVLMSKERAGFYETLREMGANIVLSNYKNLNGEIVVDITAKSSVLNGVEVLGSMAASMIDEYPIIAVVAAFCNGCTILKGLSNLRTKESDRINEICKGLTACGVKVELLEGDSIKIWGKGPGSVDGGAKITGANDHRIAMSFLVMGAFTKKPVIVDGVEVINTSFPDFISTFNGAGGAITPLT